MPQRKSRAAKAGLVEHRTFSLRTASIDETGKRFTGVAMVFGEQAMIGQAPWGFRESFAPGAFTKTLQEGDPVFLNGHDPNQPLARQSAATLRLAQTATELEVDAALPNTSYAADLAENIRVGNVKGMSVGFSAVKDRWTIAEDGIEERVVLEATLPELSATPFPAYVGTSAGLRSMCDAIRTARHVEQRDDTDPADLAAAVDAALDEACDLVDGLDTAALPAEVAQALALMQSAGVTVDSLLEAMGIPDTDPADEDEPGDETNSSRSSRQPPSGTGPTHGTPEPGQPTRSTAALQLRMRALAALNGLPAAQSTTS